MRSIDTREASGVRRGDPAAGIVWLRRDLRLDDHAALNAAVASCERVTCAFVLDPELLRGDRMGAPIVQFFFDSLRVLRDELRERGSDLALLEGDFASELTGLARRLAATDVFYNEDYDPSARERDERVTRALGEAGIAVRVSADLCIVEPRAIVQSGGKPYTVYTPYRRRWNALIADEPRRPYPSLANSEGRLTDAATIGSTREIPRPEDYGHASSDRYPRGGLVEAKRLLTTFTASAIGAYADERNQPAIAGTSHLSPHLRAGTIGIRRVLDAALRARERDNGTHTGIDTWIGELTWRDFYQQLLLHIPRVAQAPFIGAAESIPYREDARDFDAWANGRTGYPIVDAAMVQLNTTGWMHNRLRMVVASFLTKHLLIDYRRGERYFEGHLADADLAANNGGWQWSSSTGTDAAPYFRVFNPTLQGKTFDPDGTFVRRMLPALANIPARYVHEPWAMPPLVAASAGFRIGVDYPEPIVAHASARTRAIQVYGQALSRRA